MATNSKEDVDLAEDLVLQNSPLDQYLKELGMSEFASYSALGGDEICGKSESEVLSHTLSGTRPGQPDEPHHGPKSMVHWPSKGLVSNFMHLINRYIIPKSSHDLRNSLNTILALFSNSTIICSDDKDQKWATVIKPVVEKSSESARTTGKNYCKDVDFIGKILDITSVQLLLISIAIGYLFYFLQSKSIFSASLLVAVVVILLVVASYSWFIRQRTDDFSSKAIQLTKTFISNFETICTTLDKSFLLVRECEIIAQGYTFYHPGLPTVAIGSRKRGSCFTLREAIMENCLKLFEIIGCIAKQLVNCLPRDIYLLYNDDGIFNISADDLRSSIAEIGWNRKGIPQTDLIRSMICLIKSELIELFQIILLLVEKHLTGGEECYGASSDLQNLLITLHEIYTINNATVSNILDDISSKLSFTKENEFKENLCGNRPGISLPSSPMQFKIDSAFLHLKCAVGQLESLESMLPNILESDVDSRVDDNLAEKVNSLANVFNQELASAKECVADISKSLLPEMDNIPVDRYPVLGKSDVPEEQDLNVKLFNCDSPAQQGGDLLLEGVSDPSQCQDEFVDTKDSLLGEKKLNEQLNGIRLIKELKAIFSYKKSPVGLVPLDLVKERLNIGGSVKEVTDDVVATQSVSMSGVSTKPSLDAASCVHSPLHRREDQASIEYKNQSTMSGGVVPSFAMLNDLKSALLHRQQQGLSDASVIESDTFEFASDALDGSSQDES